MTTDIILAPIFNAIMTDWFSRPRFVDYRTKHRYFLCRVASSSITDPQPRSIMRRTLIGKQRVGRAQRKIQKRTVVLQTQPLGSHHLGGMSCPRFGKSAFRAFGRKSYRNLFFRGKRTNNKTRTEKRISLARSYALRR